MCHPPSQSITWITALCFIYHAYIKLSVSFVNHVLHQFQENRVTSILQFCRAKSQLSENTMFTKKIIEIFHVQSMHIYAQRPRTSAVPGMPQGGPAQSSTVGLDICRYSREY